MTPIKKVCSLFPGLNTAVRESVFHVVLELGPPDDIIGARQRRLLAITLKPPSGTGPESLQTLRLTKASLSHKGQWSPALLISVFDACHPTPIGHSLSLNQSPTQPVSLLVIRFPTTTIHQHDIHSLLHRRSRCPRRFCRPGSANLRHPRRPGGGPLLRRHLP